MIPRPRALHRLQSALAASPVTALLGPRQCGKTTLARTLAKEGASDVFDLEDPVDLRRLTAPQQALSTARGLVVIDEIQRRPELFEILRVLVDADADAGEQRFLILGSASPHLVKAVSETLAGRIAFVDLGGLSLSEVGSDRLQDLWVRGGFPRSLLASSNRASMRWREDFVRTFLERDVPQLGITVPAETLRRFWTMVAHYHGQTWNAAQFARSLGASENTARRYLDILAGAFVLRVLPPWFENLRKRQVKAPKVFVRDSGLLHALLQLDTFAALQGHPKLGASWEGFALEEALQALETRDAYYWATHAGAELDLMVRSHGKRYGFEFKYADAPGLTKSMRIALGDLALEHIWVVYPGSRKYELSENVSVVPVSDLSKIARSLGASG